jgi:gluconate 2-dehydrogenase gamma chain
MSTSPKSRREFLVGSATGLSATWIAAHYTEILAAGVHAQEAAAAPAASDAGRSFAFFTTAQAADVEAMAAQIIPTDDTPGAREARVVYFIDRALVTFFKDKQDDYKRGLETLTAETRKLVPGAASFAALRPPQQIHVLTAIEKTPFFNLVRTHTITGFFAHPIHGGNHDKVGWKLVEYNDSLSHTPPFGYYDALPQFRG